jgi:hydrogenase maturation protease
VPEATALVALLDTDVPTILVDAVLGEPPGQVLELGVGELALRAPLRVSSHGLGVSEAIALAQTLNNTLPSVRVVAVTIAMPERYAQGMTAAVDAAVPRAVERVVSLLEVEHA